MPTPHAVNATEFMLSTPLRCPFCGDPQASFHSRVAVSLGGKIEWAGIFVCSDSHIFMVPLKCVAKSGHRDRQRPVSLDELATKVAHRIKELRATLHSTKEAVYRNRLLRQRILSTAAVISERRTGRPYGLPIQ